MTTAKLIKKAITDKGPDQIWDFSDFSNLPPQAVAQAFSRMAKAGFLIRVKKGIYHYPRQTALGATKPDISQLALRSQDNPKKATLGGASGFYNLGLTTQVPATTVILTPAQSKGVKYGKQTVRFRSRDPKLFNGSSDSDIWLLEALNSINRIPNTTTADAILKTKSYIRDNNVSLRHLMKVSRYHSPRARALLGAIAMDLGYKGKDLAKFRSSINPLTHFKISPGNSLKHAKDWNII